MRINSPYWNEALGVCTKHNLPSVPCPACLSGEGDEDLEFILDDMDLDILRMDDLKPSDLIPKNIKNPTILFV